MVTGRRILVLIGGGVAAFKALELVRELRRRGMTTRCILTEAGANFVTALSVAALSGDKVYSDLFSLTDEAEMGHIELSRDADLLVVAPATADLLAKMAAGLANDLASTALLATDKPVLVAPAMNVRMWRHPATRRNVARLREDGVAFAGPVEGDMACGEYGPGRMAEPGVIADAVEAFFAGAPGLGQPGDNKPLAGRHIVVTSGPTYEPIDPVRYIANRSSGKQGHAIARAAAEAGARVTLISGPVAIPDPRGADVVHVETAREMMAATLAALPADAAIFCAAVADWRPARADPDKIKKSAAGAPALALAENPDILVTIARLEHGRPHLVVGFAAETAALLDHARAKLARKGCDWIIANDVSVEGGAMGGDVNAVHLLIAKGASDPLVESWPRMSKQDVATRLAERISDALAAEGQP